MVRDLSLFAALPNCIYGFYRGRQCQDITDFPVAFCNKVMSGTNRFLLRVWTLLQLSTWSSLSLSPRSFSKIACPQLSVSHGFGRVSIVKLQWLDLVAARTPLFAAAACPREALHHLAIQSDPCSADQ